MIALPKSDVSLVGSTYTYAIPFDVTTIAYVTSGVRKFQGPHIVQM